MSKANVPAFPVVRNGFNTDFGLTKREYIATQLLQAFITADDYQHVYHTNTKQPHQIQSVVDSVQFADWLLAELAKTENQE